jgi:hypothetical protein
VSPPRRIPTLALAVGAFVLLPACSSTPGSSTARDPNLISLQEIQEATVSDLFLLIQRERPRWLRGRQIQTPMGRASGEDVVVYIERSNIGGPDALRGMSLDGVQSIRFLSGRDAQQRYGLNHRMGAIVISYSAGS